MRTNSLLLSLAAGASLFSFAAAADDADALIGKWSVKKVNDQGQKVTQTFTIKKGKAVFQCSTRKASRSCMPKAI